MSERAPPGLLRSGLFAAVTVIGLLVAVNAGIEWLERRGALNTHRRDDVVQFVNEPLFVRAGDDWVTTAYATQSMVPSRFPQRKPDGAWRAFLLGGSFMMGTPYVHQDHDEERPGGIGTWLRATLHPAPGGAVTVVNLASGAASSQRVARVAEQAVQLQPDVLIVASCNNEGEFPPGRLREVLHAQGAYRLLTSMLVTPPAPGDRPIYARQDGAVEQIRAEWRARIEGIIAQATARDVPVVLCTLPVHLRFDHVDGKAFERGFLDGTRWEDDRGAPPPADPCIAEGIAQIEAGAFEPALATLRGCEDVAEALRFGGLALAGRGDPARARPLLEQAVELVPRNRCRPSFNDDLRAIAAAHPDVILADLDAAARAHAPGGLPGDEMFTDYCHLNWRGYALMARTLTDAMQAAGLLPAPPTFLSEEELGARARALDLEPLPPLRPGP